MVFEVLVYFLRCGVKAFGKISKVVIRFGRFDILKIVVLNGIKYTTFVLAIEQNIHFPVVSGPFLKSSKLSR